MENAFHLGVWGLALSATLAVIRAARAGGLRLRGWLLGWAGALLFATRPESVICVAALGALAVVGVRRAVGGRGAAATLARIAVPGALAVAAQAIANRLFTGEW